MNYDAQVFGQVLFRPINCPYPHNTEKKIIWLTTRNLSFNFLILTLFTLQDHDWKTQ